MSGYIFSGGRGGSTNVTSEKITGAGTRTDILLLTACRLGLRIGWLAALVVAILAIGRATGWLLLAAVAGYWLRPQFTRRPLALTIGLRPGWQQHRRRLLTGLGLGALLTLWQVSGLWPLAWAWSYGGGQLWLATPGGSRSVAGGWLILRILLGVLPALLYYNALDAEWALRLEVLLPKVREAGPGRLSVSGIKSQPGVELRDLQQSQRPTERVELPDY